jgi:cytidylate kinase
MAEEHVPVIAVDGPSGTGKGTLCLALARRLGWHFLDSGALYRVLAYAALESGLDLGNESALERCAQDLPVVFDYGDSEHAEVRILLNGVDVTEAIRTESGGNAASRVAALPGVRRALLARQRAFRQWPGLVADGRDMGTVVFPDADLKIFLKASPEERAARRYKQLKEKGLGVNLPHLLRDIAERDARDSERSIAPLKAASDAVVMDTTAMGVSQVFERVMELVRTRVLIQG